MVLPPGLRQVANPPNPWLSTAVEYLPGEPGTEDGPAVARLTVIEDDTKTILAKNNSPDLPFRFSVNPYRGCYHACAYCYARPSHEYLGLGAGTDFDRKIVVKPDAPALLEEALSRPKWGGDFILFSGDTDCYQPLEASYRLTRRCLEVCARHRNPCGVITKAPLIERDLDVLVELAQVTDFHVTISIPFWCPDKARAIEPYVATPQRRIKVIEKLAAANIDVGVNVAPLIPGLADEDIPKILKAASEAGARRAAMIFIRLPGNVAPVFEDRLRKALPLRAEKVLARIREARGGKLNDARFGNRHWPSERDGNEPGKPGNSAYAQTIRALFEREARRLGLASCRMSELREPTAHPPTMQQLRLFE